MENYRCPAELKPSLKRVWKRLHSWKREKQTSPTRGKSQTKNPPGGVCDCPYKLSQLVLHFNSPKVTQDKRLGRTLMSPVMEALRPQKDKGPQGRPHGLHQAGWFLPWKSPLYPTPYLTEWGVQAHRNEDWIWLGVCFPRAASGHWVANKVDLLLPSVFKHQKQQQKSCNSTERPV